ncbi:MAG: hypothetical protein IIY32_09465 [Thermoguttaceae bacterium]|nr:hypothetical protein [Thermoguttaceae bacterium]
MRILLSIAVFAALLGSACVYAAPHSPSVGAADEQNYYSAFLTRTPEEYREQMLGATSEAQIDAIVGQMIVQELRERGEDHPDDYFLDLLETPEMKEERLKRIQYWLGEQKKAKEDALKIDYRKYGIGVGMILVVLVLILLIGGKRNQNPDGKPEKETNANG